MVLVIVHHNVGHDEASLVLFTFSFVDRSGIQGHVCPALDVRVLWRDPLSCAL